MLPYRHDKADELRSASALGAVDAMREVTKNLGKCWCYRLPLPNNSQVFVFT